MVKKIVTFNGNESSNEIRDFFKLTYAEVLDMRTGFFDGRFLFTAIIEVDQEFFERDY